MLVASREKIVVEKRLDPLIQGDISYARPRSVHIEILKMADSKIAIDLI